MKIVMVCEFFNETLGFQENLLLKYFSKQGHEVSIITSTYRDVFDYYHGKHDRALPRSRETIEGGGTVIRLPFRYNFLNKLKAYRGFADELESEAPDFIFVHDISPNFPEMVQYLRSHPDARMIMDYHADYSNSGKNWLSLKILHGVFRNYFLKQARPYLEKIYPIVPAGFTFLNEVYGVPMEEMDLLPLGADTDLAKGVRTENPSADIRRKHNIGPDDFVIITGGKLERRKKVELLLQAVEMTGRKNIHVLIAGKFPPDDQEYETFLHAEAQKLGSQAHFVGWLNGRDMFRHMSASNMAVFPASQSVLWLQSIACGLPLVVGDTGGQDISYVNLYDNLMMLKGDEISAKGIYEKIQMLVDNPSLLKSMSEGALKTSDEMLDWNRIADTALTYAPKIDA